MGKLTDGNGNLNTTDLRKRARARAKLEEDRRLPHIQVNFVGGHASNRGFVREPAVVRSAMVQGETINRGKDESEVEFKTRVLGMQIVGKPSFVVWVPDLPPNPNISVRPLLPPEAER